MSSDDVRARRAERVREQKMKQMPKEMARRAAFIGVAILVVGALGYAVWWSSFGKPDNVHWHAAWEMYAWDEESQSYRHFDFNNPAYDLQSGTAFASSSSYHLHTDGRAGDDDIVHLEFKPPPFPVWRFFEGMTVEISKSSVKLDDLHGGERYRENDTHEWRLFVQKLEGEWHEEPKFEDYNMKDGDRVLVTFGNPEDMDGPGGELERQLASVTTDIPGYDNAERGEDRVARDQEEEAEDA